MLAAHPRFLAKINVLAAALGLEYADAAEVHEKLRLQAKGWATSEAVALVALKVHPSNDDTTVCCIVCAL